MNPEQVFLSADTISRSGRLTIFETLTRMLKVYAAE